MMFENLSARLQSVFSNLRNRGRLTEKDVDLALREVRMALLEADVNFKVARDFTTKVRERAVGEEVMKSLTPAQQVIKIVQLELTELMGGQAARIAFASRPPTVMMLVGLQGSGKTTSCAKLANLMRKQGHKPLLVAGDVYRPAAIKQLQVLGDQLGVEVFSMGDKTDPVDIAAAAVERGRSMNNSVVILDTAGRLHVDDQMMDELERIKSRVNPTEILLVVDAMTGQDAVNVASVFNDRLGIDGVILTKLDGDARGGAALSVRAVTGKPIKFVTTGEKLDALEQFHPERMASRILGMGDVLTIIEKAEEAFNAEQAMKLEEKLRKEEFTLEDFLSQLQDVRKMGPIDQLLGMIPGLNRSRALKGVSVDEKDLARVEAIIRSMTPAERRNPAIIGGSRKRRIANGSGVRVQDVNALLKQFEQTRKMLKQFGDMAKRGGPSRKMPFMP
ncbi:MAG: signal recognition particle protein [Firmicutes bacterium]|jgi:signal recognition particle subunit SRP54|nr:signal recognition particle protein [Bacillota bacterium]MDD4336263.1 signal recognition particle protein [Bacillota bacterium]MDD4791650.1 signal recognition particle protein [Bacillota bacterium]